MTRVKKKVLVIDIGGTHVKVLATDREAAREFDSGPALTPKQMVSGVRRLVADWDYDVVSIGYPGVVLRNRPIAEPWNLGKGWVGFNFEAALNRPVKVINDAAMQALGSYKRQDAVPRTGKRSGIRPDRGRRCGADGVRALAL